MKNKNLERKILSLCILKIDDEDEMERVKNNLKYFSETEIMIFNSGELKNPNLDNETSENWSASENYGTPGEANSSLINN